MKILVLNAGSSSQKIRLYELNGGETPETAVSQPPAPLWAADADWGANGEHATIIITTPAGPTTTQYPAGQREQILTHLLQQIWQGKQAAIEQPSEIAIAGHRVVHGGARYRESVLITPRVRADLHQLTSFAPLHEPANLEGIEVVERLLGGIPQVAVFDTAFHRTLPLVAQIYAGPYSWFEQDIRRYGFHGISHRYCARRSAQLLGRELSSLRVVTCHLGNGCSLAAIRDGQSIDTTMGFTPLEGLMMGTRSGTIDPEILLYLQRTRHMTPEDLERVLNHESGLQGISGLSGDMRTILREVARGNERAQLALELYIYRLRSCLGSMVAALEGIDVLTFTGGVGEHAVEVRARLCAHLGYLGLTLDAEKNASASGDQEIGAAHSGVRVLVVHTEEDWEIARACREIASSAQ
ncbi:MAG TPA: acetate kinase [Ktedonobacteraceae bacterium]